MPDIEIAGTIAQYILVQGLVFIAAVFFWQPVAEWEWRVAIFLWAFNYTEFQEEITHSLTLMSD
jgi:hypothetical protein